MPDKCPICFEGLAENLAITKCEHIFHQSCIAKWVASKREAKCPTCRIKIRPKKGLQTFRLNPLQLVLDALGNPQDYIESFDGANKSKLKLAFAKLQSSDGGENIAALAQEVDNQTKQKALGILRKKIQKLESDKLELEDSKIKAMRDLQNEKKKTKEMTDANIRMNAQFSMETAKLRRLVEENIRLKEDVENIRRSKIKGENQVVELKNTNKELKENLEALAHIEELRSNVPENQVSKLESILKGKSDKQKLKVVTDMYLYLRTEHTQLTQEFKSKKRSEQADIKSLRDKITMYQVQNDDLREQIQLQGASLKKYKSRWKKMDAERKAEKSAKAMDDERKAAKVVVREAPTLLKDPTLSSSDGFLEFKSQAPEKVQISQKKTFFPQTQMKRKNPFGHAKKKRKKPLRL